MTVACMYTHESFVFMLQLTSRRCSTRVSHDLLQAICMDVYAFMMMCEWMNSALRTRGCCMCTFPAGLVPQVNSDTLSAAASLFLDFFFNVVHNKRSTVD